MLILLSEYFSGGFVFTGGVQLIKEYSSPPHYYKGDL